MTEPNPAAVAEAEELAEKPFDASDPQAVNEARKKSGRKRKKQREVLQKIMAHQDGRELVYDFVKCIVEGNPAVPGDPVSTYFNLGQEYRAKALFMELVKIVPDDLIKMLKENLGK